MGKQKNRTRKKRGSKRKRRTNRKVKRSKNTRRRRTQRGGSGGGGSARVRRGSESLVDKRCGQTPLMYRGWDMHTQYRDTNIWIRYHGSITDETRTLDKNQYLAQTTRTDHLGWSQLSRVNDIKGAKSIMLKDDLLSYLKNPTDPSLNMFSDRYVRVKGRLPRGTKPFWRYGTVTENPDRIYSTYNGDDKHAYTEAVRRLIDAEDQVALAITPDERTTADSNYQMCDKAVQELGMHGDIKQPCWKLTGPGGTYSDISFSPDDDTKVFPPLYDGATTGVYVFTEGEIRHIKKTDRFTLSDVFREYPGSTIFTTSCKICSSLRDAVKTGDITTLTRLLGEGADPDVSINGITPLMLAAKALHGGPCVIPLLEKGASAAKTNNEGQNALMVAIIDGSNIDQVIRPLVEATSNSKMIDIQDNKGKTALIWAAFHVATRTIRAILDVGASVNIQDNLGQTALMVAVEEGAGECMTALLEANADVKIQDNLGDTALMLAISGPLDVTSSKRGNIISSLILATSKAGTGGGIPLVDIPNKVGMNALMLAVEAEDTGTMQALLDVGAKTTIQDLNISTVQELIATAGRWKDVAAEGWALRFEEKAREEEAARLVVAREARLEEAKAKAVDNEE